MCAFFLQHASRNAQKITCKGGTHLTGHSCSHFSRVTAFCIRRGESLRPPLGLSTIRSMILSRATKRELNSSVSMLGISTIQANVLII